MDNIRLCWKAHFDSRAVHCLMTAKTQELYKGVLDSLVVYIPEFKPGATKSDWEQASRNAFKEVFPQIRIYGCLFHYTQRIWSKVQKLGLTHDFQVHPFVDGYSVSTSLSDCYNIRFDCNAEFRNKSSVNDGKAEKIHQKVLVQSNISRRTLHI